MYSKITDVLFVYVYVNLAYAELFGVSDTASFSSKITTFGNFFIIHALDYGKLLSCRTNSAIFFNF